MSNLTSRSLYEQPPPVLTAPPSRSLLGLPQTLPPNRIIYQQSRHHTSPQQTKQHTGRNKLRELRDKLYRSRLRLKERRSELREERATAGEIEAQLADLLRRAWQEGSLPEKARYEQLYNQLQNARDEITGLEYDYEQEENEHEVMEAELEKDEEQQDGESDAGPFESNTNETRSQSGEDSAAPKSSRESSPPSTAFSNVRRAQRDAILKQYQSRLGDGNIMWERLQDMLQAYSRSIKVYYARKAVSGVDITPELQKVHESQDLCLKAKSDLELIRGEIQTLEQQAREASMEVSPPFWISNEQSIPPSQPASVMITTPLAVTQQGGSAMTYVQNNASAAEARVDIWILESLEESVLEHVRHKATLQALWRDTMDDETWARFLLLYWRADEVGEDTGQGQRKKRSSSVAANTDRWAILSHFEIFVTPTAVKAVRDFDVKFQAFANPPTKPRGYTVSSATHRLILQSDRQRFAPYKDGLLDMDILSVYECRSNAI
ncbi:hypothetical protein MMC30_001716 [Trapelia coarctata]|nr:hypothetical protein [Trapelia coarctata]